MIETCKKIIERIEKEISELLTNCEDLSAAGDSVNCSDRILSGSDAALKSVEKACERGKNLRVMNRVHEDMIEAISGIERESALQALEQLLQDIRAEERRRNEKIEKLRQELRDAVNELEKLLSGGA